MFSKEIFGGEYEVRTDGKIFSNKRKAKTELVGKIAKTGYRMILLTINKKKNYKNAHRIVAETFIPNPNNYPQVNHKDGNKLNNSVANLEWVSPCENLIHARDSGLLNTCKITMEDADNIRSLYKTNLYTQKQLASKFNLGKTQIGYIINNKRWKNN